uniref:Uncharacterized protein n=1 Tax=Sphenodon punctatus TaxID=8508 RepID=A0A8D0L6J4_SPHPU
MEKLVSSAVREELLCPICYDPFKEAVSLGCGHHFCKGCIIRSWRDQSGPVCAVCKEPSALDDLRPNHTLDSLVEKLLKQEQGSRGPALCFLHQEEARFFCAEDKELVCFACQSSKQHKNHKVCPIGEAAKDYRAKWKNLDKTLREKMKEFELVQSSYESFARHNQVSAAWLEQQIKKQFKELRRFLRNEEVVVLAELKEEVSRKRGLIKGKIKTLTEDHSSLLWEVTQLQTDLQEEDHSFLLKHKNQKRRLACTMEPEAVLPGVLIDVAKYLGSLQYKAWKKMRCVEKGMPFSLDPNTSAGWLSISDNLTSVANRSYGLAVNNRERFYCAPCILGSKCFSQSLHTWEVEVTGVKDWRIGVAKRPDDARRSFLHRPRSGFWYIGRRAVDGDKCHTSNLALLETPLENLRRIQVELNCDEGELSFRDAERQTHIYAFHENFGGEVFPYFYVGRQKPSIPSEPLRICPLRVLIKEIVPM